MRPLNWEYIAGFFDGEGCVTTHANRARRGLFGTHVIFSQSGERGRLLLVAIQAFVAAVGVKGYVMHINKRHAKTPMYSLVIAARPSVEEILRRLRGRVIIKKTIVEDTYRFLQVYPTIRGAVATERNMRGTLHVDTQQVLRDRQGGMKNREIAAKYGISISTIEKRLQKARAASAA